MKAVHCFLGLFFLISIVVSQSVDAGSPVPAGLESAIESVKKKIQAGASKKEIAAFVTRTVANRVTFLNHNSKKLDSFMGDAEIAKNLKRFNAFWDKGNLASDEFSAAVWVWTNRIGQCNEGASTAFHILVMAYESTDEIITVAKGDHRFVILGDAKNIPNIFSADDLRKLDNTYIVDPWDGVSFSTKDLSFFDWFQHGNGNTVTRFKYKFYKRKYDKFLTWCKKNPVEYQKWLHGLSDAEAEAAAEAEIEHEDSMNFKLDQHRKKIDALRALRNLIITTGSNSLDKAKYNLNVVEIIQATIKSYETKIVNHVDQGETACDEARKLHQKIIALSAAMEDGEALANTKIDLAKDRRANCKTDADGVFIKNNYQAAQDAYAIMIKAKDAALVAYTELKDKLEQIKGINDYLKKHDSTWWKEQRDKHKEFLKAVPQHLDQLETGIKDAKGFPSKIQALKKKIEASKKYYIQYFPGATAKFDQLISEVASIKLSYVIDHAGLSDLSQDYQTAQTALDTPTGNNPRLFRGAPPLINCFSDTSSKKVMDKIDEVFLRVLLVLKTSDYLRDGCKVKVAVQEPPEDNDGSPPPPSVNTDGSTPGTPFAASGNGSGQSSSSNTMGGLIIVGPAELVAGQGITYTACDGTGVPYTSGSFSWGFTDESIMNLGKSGNPVSGVGFKAGKVTIFVHYDGGDVYSGTAWLDVKIKAKENNLFSTSGGEDSEENENGQGNLFSTSGGEDSEDNENGQGNLFSSSVDEQTGSSLFSSAGEEANKTKNQCNQLLGNISSALDRGDTVSAQNFTNSAFALGCDIDPVVLAQVENIEKRNKEQREQQIADTARKEEQQEEECRKIRLDIIAAANQGNVGALQNLAGQSANMGCNNTSYINRLITKIEAKKRQQQAQTQRSQQPQNQANWMDVMNMIVKGVKDVQQEHSKPSRTTSTSSSGSKPLPASGQSQTYNGPLCKGHHLVCGYGYNEYKHAVNDFNQDKICDICRRPYAKQGYRVFTKKVINGPCVKYYSKLDGPICQGHVLICDQGYGRTWKMAIDRNPRDRICDICGRSFKKSGNKVRSVITKKNVKCREEKK